MIARSLSLDSLAASGSRALAEVAVERGALLRALGYAEQAVILSMGQDDLEASAATLLLVGAEAGRAGLDDVARPANEGAAEIYRLLERDDLAQMRLADPASRRGAEARTDRLEAGLEAARSVVDPTRTAGETLTDRSAVRDSGRRDASPLVGGAVPLGGDDITRLLLAGS